MEPTPVWAPYRSCQCASYQVCFLASHSSHPGWLCQDISNSDFGSSPDENGGRLLLADQTHKPDTSEPWKICPARPSSGIVIVFSVFQTLNKLCSGLYTWFPDSEWHKENSSIQLTWFSLYYSNFTQVVALSLGQSYVSKLAAHIESKLWLASKILKKSLSFPSSPEPFEEKQMEICWRAYFFPFSFSSSTQQKWPQQKNKYSEKIPPNLEPAVLLCVSEEEKQSWRVEEPERSSAICFYFIYFI